MIGYNRFRVFSYANKGESPEAKTRSQLWRTESMFLKFLNKKISKQGETSARESGLIHGVDSSMNYCPSCGDEYRGEIVTCGSCNTALISGAEKLKKVVAQKQQLAERTMELQAGDELVSIRKGPVKDITSLQKLLASHRIPSLIAGDERSCRKGCCGPELYLQIKKEDLEIATAVLTKDFIQSTALDSHDLQNAYAVFDPLAAETLCPACGCRFSPTVGACPECGLCFE